MRTYARIAYARTGGIYTDMTNTHTHTHTLGICTLTNIHTWDIPTSHMQCGHMKSTSAHELGLYASTHTSSMRLVRDGDGEGAGGERFIHEAGAFG